MKKFAIILVMLCVGFTYAQNGKQPKVEKDGDLTLVTYYHDNGEIQQQGTFNAKGKLHGEWKSYDMKGKKLSLGSYENGKRVGKWFFWEGDSLKEVDYMNSKIINVNQWNNKTKVATRN